MKADLKMVQNLYNPKIKECPYCGEDTFYYKQHMSGTGNMFVRFDGDETENGDMHEALNYTPMGKFAYCANCKKKVLRFRK